MKTIHAAAAVAIACAAASAQAASVYLTPASQTVPLSDGLATVDLIMDFAISEATLGGGIDLDVQGAASLIGFAPSPYFTTVADPAFSGWGTARADNDLEIHFGSFNGLSGLNTLGTLTVALNRLGLAPLELSINTFYGGFVSSATFATQDVQLFGALITVVPEPQGVLLMLAGLAAVGAGVRRSTS